MRIQIIYYKAVDTYRNRAFRLPLTYWERHSPGSGCAGIHGNKRTPNCRCPSSTVLRLGDPDRHPAPVSPSKAQDVRSAEAGKVIVQRCRPRSELATTLFAPVGWRLRADDLANDATVDSDSVA